MAYKIRIKKKNDKAFLFIYKFWQNLSSSSIKRWKLNLQWVGNANAITSNNRMKQSVKVRIKETILASNMV